MMTRLCMIWQIHHLLDLKVENKDRKPATESSKGTSPSKGLKQNACLASSCGTEGHVCGTGHCLNTLSEQNCQLAKFYGRLSMSNKI